ncbi:MAG: hypothetical protein QNK43_14320 [Amphritea sp.]|jgi:hypothetical protein|nr:hypothetical protein [uncultured Amphritea sp.]MDX2423837.1 hypothetical protein [Amphritea sp.]
MLKADAEDKMKAIDKKIGRVAIIDLPGSIMVGLGLYAKFGANGDAFHPFLNNPNNVNIILTVGAAIMIWGGYKVITLAREKKRLAEEYGI